MDPRDDVFGAGAFAGAGTFFCLECGSQLSTEEAERLPKCPACGGESFRRDSIFASRQDHGATAEFELPAVESSASWLEKAREGLPRPGRYLVLRDRDGEMVHFRIGRGWIRIGRSVAADLRLDDPSVSRRHALIVSEQGKQLRVLNDRSLNGVLLNGVEIEWETLADGDELTIGRYHFFLLES